MIPPFPHTLNEYRTVALNANQIVEIFRREYDQHENKELCKGRFPCLNAQKLFLDHIIHHKSVTKFPLPSQYVVKVIKRLIHEVEHCEDGGNEEGVSEELMELYWDMSASLPAAQDSFSQRHLQASHRIYNMSNLLPLSSSAPSSLPSTEDKEHLEEHLITLKVWPAFTHVGLAMWEAGYYIAEWILANEHLFYGKRVLELGSGVGLSALALARSFDKSIDDDKLPQAIYMTDYLDIILRNCVDNMKINGLDVVELFAGANRTENAESDDDDDDDESTPKAHQNRTRLVHVSELDWTKFSDEQLEAIDANVILAADVIYDLSVIEGLVDVTSRLIFNNSKRSSKGDDVVVFFAITKRNEKTFEFFKQQCANRNMETEDVTCPLPQLFPYEGRENVRMFKLYAANQ